MTMTTTMMMMMMMMMMKMKMMMIHHVLSNRCLGGLLSQEPPTKGMLGPC